MIVVDASAVTARLLRGAGSDAVDPEDSLHAPQLCSLEVVASLRNRVLRGELTRTRAALATLDYLELDLALHVHDDLAARCFELVDNFTPYDASYVALAELLDAPLLTFDRAFARAVEVHTNVELLAP
ncbi:MAG: type II toxin-antitoxin system VapC family toxin [Gaiellaceae bacterium]